MGPQNSGVFSTMDLAIGLKLLFVVVTFRSLKRGLKLGAYNKPALLNAPHGAK